MAASTFAEFPASTSDALFRAWGSAISAALAAGGLVQTADSGQVNWTTVVAPASAAYEYEIWRFADALQATKPVFLKLEYGNGVNPGMAFQLGSGSNGSGTLTGTTSTRTTLTAYGNSVANAFPSYISAGLNRLLFYLWHAPVGATAPIASCLIGLSLERTVDAAGAATGEGVLITWRSPSTGTFQQAWNCTTGNMTAGAESTLGMMGPSIGTGASGADVAVYPQYLTKGVFLLPGLNLLGIFEANVTPGTPTSFTYYGATHTYMPLVSGSSNTPVQRVGFPCSLLLRYE